MHCIHWCRIQHFVVPPATCCLVRRPWVYTQYAVTLAYTVMSRTSLASFVLSGGIYLRPSLQTNWRKRRRVRRILRKTVVYEKPQGKGYEKSRITKSRTCQKFGKILGNIVKVLRKFCKLAPTCVSSEWPLVWINLEISGNYRWKIS